MPLLDSLISVLAPHSCVSCGREGKLLCAYCLPDAFITLPSRCYRCKRITQDFAVCDKCKISVRPRHVWVRTYYDGNAKKLLQSYKFERARSASQTISEAMLEVLPYLNSKTLIVPVPTATSRVRQRGYDQAILMAKNIARSRNYEYSHVVSHLYQSRQVGASRQKRLAQLNDSFVVTKPDIVTGREILLIDDVVTTGATLEAMTQVLKKSDAKKVNALIFSQKQ